MADRPRLKSPFDAAPPAPAQQATATDEAPPRRSLRFSTKTFLAAVFVLAFAAAGYGGMSQHGDDHKFYVIFSLMTPFVALAIAALTHRFARRVNSRPADDSASPFDS